MSFKQQFKALTGVEPSEVVKRFNENKEAFQAALRKQKYDYDVSALDPWTDNTLPNVVTDLIANSEFLSELTVEEGVKGTREIALLNADIELQAKSGCTGTPDGSTVFTGVDLTTVPIYAGIEFCNEDLNGKMTQVLNALGLKKQNGQLPAEIETILMAYLMRVLQRKAQRVVILGDDTSLDAELALFDGLRKIINADVNVATFDSAETAIDDTNGYALAYGVFTAIDPELLDNGMTVQMYTGRTEALNIIKAWNDANAYSQINVPAQGTSMIFDLPLTGITVKTLPELNGLNEIFAIPTALTFLGTDEMADMSLDIKYNDYTDELKAECSFRLGTNIVWGKYFTRLNLNAS